MGPIPDSVTVIFHWHNLCDHTMTPWGQLSLYQEYFLWSKGGWFIGGDNLTTFMCQMS